MTQPYYQDEHVTLFHGDCLDVLRELPDASVDAVVTDPPYGLEFMGREWDSFGGDTRQPFRGEIQTPNNPYGRATVRFAGASSYGARAGAMRSFQDWCEQWATECLRVLKPGGHLLAFGGSRTWHRLACGVEDAGFEVRDSIAWLHAQGFPKSLDVAKAITGAETGYGSNSSAIRRATMGEEYAPSGVCGNRDGVTRRSDTGMAGRDLPLTENAKRWQGWGTALKPSHEPVVVARKPAGLTAILDTIGSQLGALEEACRRRVSGAARSSARTRADSSVARTATAPASAATQHGAGQEPTTATGAAASSSAATATSASEWTAERFLSTVTSWRECLAEISAATSTSTTSTATSRTTDLQTLSSCLSSIMQSVTAQSILDPRSWSSLATAADNLFAATVLSSRSTLALSAPASATDSTPTSRQGEAGRARSHFEPVVVARKPLAGTVAANVLAHGTGALNVDACRIATPDALGRPHGVNALGVLNDDGWSPDPDSRSETHPGGRWPTNVVLDDATAAELDRQSGTSVSRVGKPRGAANGDGWGMTATGAEYDDEGGASRFFPTFRYEAKAPTAERPKYWAHDCDCPHDEAMRPGGTCETCGAPGKRIAHPTVKPLDYMRWLVRLVTPPGGTVLEPFAGSGTTAEACVIEGFRCIAIEREADYLPLIVARLTKPIQVALDLDGGTA